MRKDRPDTQIGAPSPPCPNCLTGNGRWIELAFVLDGDAAFICVNCGHYWTASPTPETASALAFTALDPLRVPNPK